LAARERVGQAAAPATSGDAAGVGEDAAVLAAPVLADAAGLASVVVAGAADGLALPQAAASAATQVSAAPAIAARAIREDAVIVSVFLPRGGSASRVSD
jgi:hypothetical protein